MNNETTNYWKYAAGFLALLMIGGMIGYGTILLSGNSDQPAAFVAQTSVSPTAESSVVDLKIKGNKNSKIYHLPGCASYHQIKERNIVWFKTAEEAQAAGFRMAKNC